MPVIVAKPLTSEWHAARQHAIGASEIAIAAGLSPYATPRELYHRKRGELPPVEDTDAMRLGRLLEPIVKAEFCRRFDMTLQDDNPPMARHAEHPEIVATPDGIVTSSALLETKTASWRMKQYWGNEETDAVPDQYVCQCQAQMSVWNADLVHLAVLFDGADLKTYTIVRNEELIRLLLAAALELWQRIRDGQPPEPTWTHPSTPALIRELHATTSDTRVVLTPDEAWHWAEYERLGKEAREADQGREMHKAHVLHAIGDHGAGLLGDGRMVRRKLITKEPYTVTPKPYIDVRATKVDGGRIVEREAVSI